MTWIPCLLLLITTTVSGARKAYYASKTPYSAPPSTYELPLPPPGFEIVCTQIVNRHGCRALEGRKYDRLTLALWAQAKEEDALTDLGYQLARDLQIFIDVNDEIGRGELSQTGKKEQRDLAHRLTERLLPLFAKPCLNNTSNRIRIVSSGKARTIASAKAFVEGLPKSLSPLIENEPPNSSLLAFHDNSIYQFYVKKDRFLKAKLRTIESHPYSKQVARNVLERLYKPAFIDRLAHGHYYITEPDSKKSIKDEVDAVRMLHGLYLIGSNLREEGVGDLLEKYFSSEESAWFAYLYDAKEYYEKGPGFADQTIIQNMAQILLDDFIFHSEKCSQNEPTHMVRARFGHAETIMPFVALLQIPILSDKSTPYSETYTYENNAWRGELISPMSANIQWEIYRHTNYGKTRFNRHQHILVRMLLNEYPVPFKYDCRPFHSASPLFYTLEELKRCYSIV